MSRPASKTFLKALRASDRKRAEVERAASPAPAPERKPAYAQEVMLRVSWSCLNHADGQQQHCRRDEVMLDLGLEKLPDPSFTNDEMQRIAFAAKMAALKALSARKRGAQ